MKTAYLGKSGSYPLWHKMLSTNRIAVLFDHQYLWMESIDTFDLVDEDNHQPKVGSERLLLLVGCGQVCLSSSQSAGFFDDQYLWKESSDILSIILHRVSPQVKISSETTTFHWVWPIVLLVKSYCGILWSISQKRVKW